MMGIRITSAYSQLKLDELRLMFEYQMIKQEEKEAAKEARARQREEAKAAKELEEAKKKLEKEQTHYENALSRLNAQIEAAKTEEERTSLQEKKAELEQQLATIDREMQDVDYRAANQRAGYVYIISNIGAFGPDVYKIGMTRRLDPMDRVDELGDASVPFNFDVHAMIFTDDAPRLEAALHSAFADRKLNFVNQRREFFHVTLEEIKQVVRENYDKTVEFVDIPPAEQYRESLLLRQQM
jgi:multidrug efflux pump subunit AcrA (membrane-fusion protein)